ncbi:hypothetical protein [Ornithinibacillus salinisoli]
MKARMKRIECQTVVHSCYESPNGEQKITNGSRQSYFAFYINYE